MEEEEWQILEIVNFRINIIFCKGDEKMYFILF